MILSRPNESLDNHIESVKLSYADLSKGKGIDKVVNGIIEQVCIEEGLHSYTTFIKKAVLDILEMHDVGKKSKYFQAYLRNKEGEYTKDNKRHSIVSAYYYLLTKHNELKELGLKGREGRVDERKLKEIMCVFANIINLHHSSLVDYNKGKLLDKIDTHIELYRDAFFEGVDVNIIKYYKKSNVEFKGLSIYFLSKYMYSVLVTCDFMAVHNFKKGSALKLNVIDSAKKQTFLNDLNNNQIIKNIRKFEREELELEGVNKYRSEMFLESEKNLKSNMEMLMYYLEAPTGCGKSLTSLNLALNMVDDVYNKIIYVAPFTNIIEQTYKDVKAVLGKKNKDVVSISCKEEIVSDNEDFDTDNMDNLLINYPFSVISHVRLFNMLFGTKRKQAISTTLLANSIIVLDEIQSYKNKIWIAIINMLNRYSKLLNIKVIIMSATLPKMNALLTEETEIVELISNRSYYFEFFKTRVENDYSLLTISIDRDENKNKLLDKIEEVTKKGDSRILVGTIRRDTCEELYKYLKERHNDYEVLKITGITSVLKKNKIIKKLKSKTDGEYSLKKVILVATQCVEAGVDIDMNIGFKNIATLDADEQFCGRIERNFKNKGIVYFYKLDEVEKIYKNDYRANKTLELQEYREILDKKEFSKFYAECFGWLLKKESDNFKEIENNIKNLQYNNIYKNLELIGESNTTNLLLNCTMNIEGGQVNLEDILGDITKIKKDKEIDYSEKEILLSRFKKKLEMFTYVVSDFNLKKIEIDREFGVYKIVDNAKDFYNDEIITEDSEIDLDRLLEGRLFY